MASNWYGYVLAALIPGIVVPGVSQAEYLVYFNEGTNQAIPNPRGLYIFDTDTGLSTFRTALSDTTSRFFAFDVRQSDGAVFGLTLDGKLTRVNPDTGQVTIIGNTGISSATGLAIRPTDGAFFALNDAGSLFSVGPQTASAVILGTTDGANFGLVASRAGQLYNFSQVGVLYRVNAANGQASFVTPISTRVVQAEDATFTAAGNLFLLDFGNNHVLKVDPITGRSEVVGTAIGTGILGVFSVAVPEPSSLLMMTLGTSGLVIATWRHARRATRNNR